MADKEKERSVEVVYATTERQRIVKFALEPGLTAGEAVRRSGLIDDATACESDDLVLGIFGTVVDEDRVLKAGDRVEICRRLLHDPREMRRALLEKGRVMGGAGRGGGPLRTDPE